MSVPLGNLILAICLCAGAFILLRRILHFPRGGPSVDDLTALKANGAQIIDVRTPDEYAQGHAPRSVNIPLDQVQARMPEIDPAVPVLLCCASGSRSGVAKSILERAGYRQVHDAGPWTRLN
jgi:rhodanese-related sulfurtransferase